MYGPIPEGQVVSVKIVVSVKTRLEDTRQILATTVELLRRNQEETAFRFRLDVEGNLVEGSVSTLKRPLVTGIE